MAKIDEAIEEIQKGIGYRTDKAGEIRLAIARAQRMLEKGRSLPWWLRTTVTRNMVAGESEIALPDDFLRISRDYVPYYLTSDGKRVFLEEGLPDDLYVRWEEEGEAGAPVAYAIEGDIISIFPPVDGAYSITVTYYKKAEELDEDAETNEWLENAFDLMVSHAGLFISQQIRNQDAGAIFQSRLQECLRNHLAETVLRDDDERPIEMGSRR